MKRKKDDVFGVVGPVIAITNSFSQSPLSIICRHCHKNGTKNKYKKLITKEKIKFMKMCGTCDETEKSVCCGCAKKTPMWHHLPNWEMLPEPVDTTPSHSPLGAKTS